MADAPRTVWFHREYVGFSGGHLKHAHYFDHVRNTPGFGVKLTYGSEKLPVRLRRLVRSGGLAASQRELSVRLRRLLRRGRSNDKLQRERAELWPVPPVAQWRPAERDVLFLAGTDWRYLKGAGLGQLPNVRINLIQHVRHAHAGSEFYGYLRERAIRICVSREVADAIVATGQTNGPVLTIPNGIDLVANAGSVKPLNRAPRILIVGYKRPALAEELAARLDEAGIPHDTSIDLLPRPAFLDALARCDIAVCLPNAEEGFYLPALEAMALDCVVITLDCIGNRGFVRHRGNCLVAADDAGSLFAATRSAFEMADEERRGVLLEAKGTAAAHSLAAERKRFQSILRNLDHLWQSPALQADLGGDMPPLPT